MYIYVGRSNKSELILKSVLVQVAYRIVLWLMVIKCGKLCMIR
jgi:hypothetical protein